MRDVQFDGQKGSSEPDIDPEDTIGMETLSPTNASAPQEELFAASAIRSAE